MDMLEISALGSSGSKQLLAYLVAADTQNLSGARKVYFIAGHYDVKLQADNRVRWDVVLRD